MEIVKAKDILELLLIIKNNFSINKYDQILMEELIYLLSQNSKLTIQENSQVCSCALNPVTIENEIEQNKCFTCGLAIVNDD